jgi:hypothetical protein
MRTGIIDHYINPLGMLCFQEVPEGLYTLRLAYVQDAELDGRIAAILD